MPVLFKGSAEEYAAYRAEVETRLAVQEQERQQKAQARREMLQAKMAEYDMRRREGIR